MLELLIETMLFNKKKADSFVIEFYALHLLRDCLVENSLLTSFDRLYSESGLKLASGFWKQISMLEIIITQTFYLYRNINLQVPHKYNIVSHLYMYL